MQMRTSLCWSSSTLTCCVSVQTGRNETGGARPTPTCPPQPCKPISSAWSLSVPVPERASLHRAFPSCPTTRASTPLPSTSDRRGESPWLRTAADERLESCWSTCQPFTLQKRPPPKRPSLPELPNLHSSQPSNSRESTKLKLEHRAYSACCR